MPTPEKTETEEESSDDSVLKLVVKKLASQALLFGVAGLVILLGAWKVSDGSLALVLSILVVFVVALAGYLFVELKSKSRSRPAPRPDRSGPPAAAPEPVASAAASPSENFAIDLWTAPAPADGAPDIAVASKQKKAGYRIGQKIVVGFRANRDCHLTLLNIGTSGKLTVLFPNALHSDNFIQAGRDYRIPEADSEFEYELQGPDGVEKLKAIATLKKVALLESSFAPDGSLFRTVDAATGARDIGIVRKKAASLPKSEWAEDACEFSVS